MPGETAKHSEVIAAISLLLLQWQSDCTPDICSQHQHVWCSFFPMQRGAGHRGGCGRLNCVRWQLRHFHAQRRDLAEAVSAKGSLWNDRKFISAFLQMPLHLELGKVAENWKTFSSLYDDRMEELYHEWST